jgi:hypothetical protein
VQMGGVFAGFLLPKGTLPDASRAE